jgi:peptidoglycan/xylan/chitin deacetylase (PgdA/CDA1 family)
VKSVSVLQHGYDHGNRAAEGAKKSEFPAARPAAEVRAALAAGRDRLRENFTEQFVPALTPPWNRFDPRYLSLLPDLGYRGLTTYLPRKTALAAPGVAQVNTHVDVIDWHDTRGFLGLGATLDLLIRHLAAKRGGQADISEPTGLLTHHLVHDTETWKFLEVFLDWCAGRPGIRWRGAADLFPVFGA